MISPRTLRTSFFLDIKSTYHGFWRIFFVFFSINYEIMIQMVIIRIHQCSGWSFLDNLGCLDGPNWSKITPEPPKSSKLKILFLFYNFARLCFRVIVDSRNEPNDSFQVWHHFRTTWLVSLEIAFFNLRFQKPKSEKSEKLNSQNQSRTDFKRKLTREILTHCLTWPQPVKYTFLIIFISENLKSVNFEAGIYFVLSYRNWFMRNLGII